MIGCICCHGPLDDEGLCPMCDWRKLDKRNSQALWDKFVKEMRQSIMCLNLKLPESIVKDVSNRFERVVYAHDRYVKDYQYE